MINPRFGLSKIGKRTAIDELMEEVEGVGAMDVQILLKEAYEIAYEIYDHENAPNDRPLALVAMHPKERYSEESRLYKTISRYKLYNVYESYGLSLTEFLSLPREFTELIFTTLSEEARKEAPRIDKELKDLESQGGMGAYNVRRRR